LPSARSSRWLAVAAVAAGTLAALLAWWLDRPPAPQPATAPAEVFSAERAFVILADLAREPHMTGSAEHERVRAVIVRALTALGFEVDVQETTVVVPSRQLHHAVTVRNVIARKRGTASTGGVALATHYDTEQLTPGAGDDGAAIAATLEALRALAQGPPLRNDLYVIATDAEELGLLGARALVDAHAWWPEIDLLLNFEARGAAGASVMFETNPGNGWVVREFARADPYPVASSLFFEIYERMPQDTDFSIYKQAGVAGLNFAFVEGADAYHRPTDTVENLSAASLQHHGEHALALARHFGNLDLAAPRQSANVVYFRVPGLGIVSYSFGLAVAFVGAAFILTGLVVRRGIVTRGLSWSGVAAGLGALVAAAALAAAVAALLLWLIGAVHHELGSIVGRELYDESWYGLAVACIAVAAYATVFTIVPSRFSAPNLAAGALSIPLGLAVVATLLVPGISMLLVWPSLFAILALARLVARPAARGSGFRRDEPFSVADIAIFAVCAAGAIVIFFPLVWAVYIGFSIAGAPTLAAVIVLMLAFLVPLFDVTARANRWWLPATAASLAVAFVAVGIANARPGPKRPVPEDLVYVLDRDSGEAFWATSSPSGSAWLSGLFGTATRQGTLSAFLVDRGSYRIAPAPLVEAARAGISIGSDGTEAQPRTVRVEILPGLVSELVTVAPGAGGASRLRAVNGVAVPAGSSADVPDWKLQHFGRAPNGALVLDLETEDDGPMELVIVEGVMRLPKLPGLERPRGVTAHAGRLTDMALVRQVMRIE
jgi:MFS family permease